MSEIYSEQDVLEALIYRSTMVWPRLKEYTVGEIRAVIARSLPSDTETFKRRERFYVNHSNKWVLRKLKLLKKKGHAVDKKFKWGLSDSQIVAQKLLGNLT